ncbi:hypothetical protein PBY51_013913 [Eleginops maclovinus]|uniref:Uncharacterized protein n=1 Tax=Eleginops maclovinus TaxID=56733 RepID=A0AAN7WY14_ELEMC|nr:hypothetical protein PBY51_013913 [Eleginops maclovinus]
MALSPPDPHSVLLSAAAERGLPHSARRRLWNLLRSKQTLFYPPHLNSGRPDGNDESQSSPHGCQSARPDQRS